MKTELQYRQSFQRFCDDYAVEILKYLTFEDKIRLLCVSKQFERCLPVKQFKMLCWQRNFGHKSALKKLWFGRVFNSTAFESLLKRFKYIDHFDFVGGYKFDGFAGQMLMTLIMFCNKIKYFRCDFKYFDQHTFYRFMNKFRSTLKYIQIFTNCQIDVKDIISKSYYWRWTY